MINDHTQWLYHKEKGPRLVKEGLEITEGWYDSPDFDNANPMWGEPEPEKPKAIAPPKKYPSQMNATELKAHGDLLGLKFDDGMTKKEMRKAITEFVEAQK